MQAAKLGFVALVFLNSCSPQEPDSRDLISSRDGKRSATLEWYQPRGTIEGKINLYLGTERERPIIIRRVENGYVGWTKDGRLVVIADRLEFNDMASNYFPDGTANSETRVVLCARQDLDCSDLDNEFEEPRSIRRIQKFPEG